MVSQVGWAKRSVPTTKSLCYNLSMSNYIRFFNNDYNIVFFTLVTNNRIPILINNMEILRKSFIYTKQKFSYEIISAVVLNDHIHIILKLQKTTDYPEIIRLIKYYFSIHIDVGGHADALPTLQVSESKNKKREKGIWQRRYWEHTIRDENDLNMHIDYIHYNPVKHGFVKMAKDWKYSTFKNFVKDGYYDENWCDFSKCEGLNYE